MAERIRQCKLKTTKCVWNGISTILHTLNTNTEVSLNPYARARTSVLFWIKSHVVHLKRVCCTVQ